MFYVIFLNLSSSLLLLLNATEMLY